MINPNAGKAGGKQALLWMEITFLENDLQYTLKVLQSNLPFESGNFMPSVMIK